MKNFSENIKTFLVMWLAYFLGARSYAVMAYHKTDFKKNLVSMKASSCIKILTQNLPRHILKQENKSVFSHFLINITNSLNLNPFLSINTLWELFKDGKLITT